MKTKLLYTLLITLLISNFILLFMMIGKPKHPKPPHKFLYSQLDFSDSQLKEATPFKDAHHQKMRKLDNEKRQLKEQFFKSISNDVKIINSDSIADLIGVNEAKKDKEILSYFKKIRRVCNEKQKKKFDKIIVRALPKNNNKKPPRK